MPDDQPPMPEQPKTVQMPKVEVLNEERHVLTGFNAGTITNVSHANVGAITGLLKLGVNYPSAQFLNGSVLDGVIRKSHFSSTELTKLHKYYQQRYALSL